jgi:hypothetical protein
LEPLIAKEVYRASSQPMQPDHHRCQLGPVIDVRHHPGTTILSAYNLSAYKYL